MSLKEEIALALDKAGVKYSDLKVDKDADHHGLPATALAVNVGDKNHQLLLADSLGLSNEEKAHLLAQHISTNA